jgi:N,N'-diacetyllegionaminate synthase
VEQLNIDGRWIGAGEPPYLIAEIGANHNGDVDLCRLLMETAKASGAHAVKLQSWSKTSLIGAAEYRRNARYGGATDSDGTLEAQVERYQLGVDEHHAVFEHGRRIGITVFSSCFAPEEVDLLETLDAPAYKIASMDVNNLPLLAYVATTRKPILLSTGMATLGEVERALDVLRREGSGPVALLHCVSIYPCPPALVNLRGLATWQQAFGVPVGFSDHTLGIAVPLAAVALGACIVEKHFTTDRTLEGWDHAISADPEEFQMLADGAAAVHQALGVATRRLSAEELAKRTVFRRRVVARHALKTGQRLSPADLDFKRPGTGIGPDELGYIVGRTLLRDLEPDDELEWADLG